MSSPPSPPPFREVTVLLGDPRLPDVTKVDAVYSREDLEAVQRLKAALAGLAEYAFRYLDDHASLLAELTGRKPAFVFNLCDTGFRNTAAMELHVPALLELLEIPYSGSPPGCMSRCYDKALVRALAAAHGVPVPRERFIRHDVPSPEVGDVFPALVKPNTGDGSIGITSGSVCRDADETTTCVERVRRELPGRDILVQEFLEGPERSVCLIGNPGRGLEALPVLEVDYSALDEDLPRILGYESKTLPESPYWKQLRYREAELEPGAREQLVRFSEVLFERLGCRDYARFDFRADSRGTVKLLEVNPNPAWCWDGKMVLMAGFAGMSESDLFGRILRAAQSRYT